MKNNGYLCIAFCFLFLVSCSEQAPPEPAQLQFVSMVPAGSASVTITPAADTLKPQTIPLSYATPTGYKSFSPGNYNISFSVQGTEVLNHNYVLGKNSNQTLVMAGMLPDSIWINPQTFWFTAGKIFAGSESVHSNGFMPQFIMLRDGYGSSKKKGAVRFVNVSPLADKLQIKDERSGTKHLVSYPRESEPVTVKLQSVNYQFNLGKIPLSSFNLTPEKAHVRTILAGNGVTSGNYLKITSYSTPVTN